MLPEHLVAQTFDDLEVIAKKVLGRKKKGKNNCQK